MTQGLDGTIEQQNVLAHIAWAVDGDPERVFTSVPEEMVLKRDAEGIFPLDYIIVSFGAMYPKEGESSLEGAAAQPQVWPIIAECWSRSKDSANATAGKVRTRMVGFQPDGDNCDEIELRGGGWFEQRDSAGRPTRWMTSVTMESSINNSVDLDLVP